MARTEVVTLCNTPYDLEIARFNGRLVLEIDPDCIDEILFKKIAALLKRVRSGKARRINTKAWAAHRILALDDLKLMGNRRSDNLHPRGVEPAGNRTSCDGRLPQGYGCCRAVAH
jgi:hypothetical protein